MGANPHANGGLLLRDLRMPDFQVHAVQVPAPGAVTPRIRSCWVSSCGTWLRFNQEQRAISGSRAR